MRLWNANEYNYGHIVVVVVLNLKNKDYVF